MGAPEQELSQLHEAPATKPGEIDDARERVERLRGADVGGGLLAADVLLARLQGEHEAATAVDITRLPRDAPGHTAQVGLAGGEEAERGAAEVEAVAKRLALPHGDVDAALAGRGEDAEHDRVDLGDRDERSPPASFAARQRAPTSSTAP